jgi:hypothetical protein
MTVVTSIAYGSFEAIVTPTPAPLTATFIVAAGRGGDKNNTYSVGGLGSKVTLRVPVGADKQYVLIPGADGDNDDGESYIAPGEDGGNGSGFTGAEDGGTGGGGSALENPDGKVIAGAGGGGGAGGDAGSDTGDDGGNGGTGGGITSPADINAPGGQGGDGELETSPGTVEDGDPGTADIDSTFGTVLQYGTNYGNGFVEYNDTVQDPSVRVTQKTSDTATIKWDYGPHAREYRVRYKESSNSTWNTAATYFPSVSDIGTTKMRQIAGLKSATLYDFEVRGQHGGSSFTSTTSTKTKSGVAVQQNGQFVYKPVKYYNGSSQVQVYAINVYENGQWRRI